MSNHNSGTTIKCRFSNEVHKILEPNIGIPKNKRSSLKKQPLTDNEKIEIYNKIVEAHNKCSNDLSSYFYDRRYKKRIHKARVARGWVRKKKTRKEDYLKSLKPVMVY